MKKTSALRCLVWSLVIGFLFVQSLWAVSSQSDRGLGTARPDSIPLLLENEVGNPYHVVLLIGIHPEGTDSFDNNLDQPFPPPSPNMTFEAYFPFDHPYFDKLKRDIRSDQDIRIVWTIVTRGAEGTMTWYPHSFPRNGDFILNGIIDMRESTTISFAYRDTMTITYIKALPEIEIEIESYDFENVLLRDGKYWTFYIKNLGEGDLIVSSITTDQADFNVVTPTTARGVVPAGSLEVTLLFAPSNLGPVSGNVTVLSSDEDEPVLFVSLVGTGVTPEIDVSSSSHDFGQVAMGESADWDVTVFNEGTGDLFVHSITSSANDFAPDPASFSIEPSDSQRVQVLFTPRDAGFISGQLMMNNSDLDEPVVTIQVTGIGIGPEIEPSITYHDFGNVVLGDSSDWTLIIVNAGAAVLVVDTVYSNQPVFSAAPKTFELPSNQAQEVSVSFIPTVLGDVMGDVVIVSNDRDEPVLTISLSGTGVEEAFPDIYVAATVHDFGQVTIGASALWIVDVTNLGYADLTISDIHSDHEFFTAEPISFTVGPSQTEEVHVTFSPTSIGSLFSQIFISSNDPDEPTVTLFLTGAGISETGVEDISGNHVPGMYCLYQNTPNPFNPCTEIGYLIPEVESPIHTTLTIYNLMGQEIRKLVDEPKGVGSYAVTWDGRDDLGFPVGSGMYYYCLKAGNSIQTRKMILLK